MTVDMKQGDAISHALLQPGALRVQSARTSPKPIRERRSHPGITFTTRMLVQPLWTDLFSIAASD